jgi:hypothetical protein
MDLPMFHSLLLWLFGIDATTIAVSVGDVAAAGSILQILIPHLCDIEVVQILELILSLLALVFHLCLLS